MIPDNYNMKVEENTTYKSKSNNSFFEYGFTLLF